MAEAVRSRDSATGWIAIALAAVIVASVASLIVFFTVGGPFGSINDAGNAMIGLLAATLAILLSGRLDSAVRWAGIVAGSLGAAVAVWGSWLVISGATGFLFAGIVSSVGYGLIGLLLALVSWSAVTEEWTGRERLLARSAAVLMVIGGVVAIPGLFTTADTFADMPAWLWAAWLGWIGVYALLPVWSFSLGRRLIGP
jgi:hypothetical protein